MAEAANIELTERQREILRRVVEEYVENGQPVGSKNLVARAGMTVAPSTVRGDLAELERLGLLTHPHTSAGRVPTETGYRFYADALLERLEPRPSPFPLDLAAARSELEAALQETTETLSQATRLLALVSAPALQTATVRHVEVLVLQPQVLMVVVITSTGGVTKRVFALSEPVDTGLALWAGEYLNERLVGLELGGATLRRRFEDPSLAGSELEILELLRPAFTELTAVWSRGSSSAAPQACSARCGLTSSRLASGCSKRSRSEPRSWRCSARRSAPGAPTSASAASSTIRPSARCLSSAPRTGWRTARSAQ